jgi:hypothetical protein
VNDELQRWHELAAAARSHWEVRYPSAARELNTIERRDGFVAREDLEELRGRYPEAVADYVGLALYSPDVIRKIRMTEPNWEPPGPAAMERASQEMQRLRDKGTEARADWERRHPAAARELEAIRREHGHLPYAHFERLLERHAEAMEEYVTLGLSF